MQIFCKNFVRMYFSIICVCAENFILLRSSEVDLQQIEKGDWKNRISKHQNKTQQNTNPCLRARGFQNWIFSHDSCHTVCTHMHTCIYKCQNAFYSTELQQILRQSKTVLIFIVKQQNQRLFVQNLTLEIWFIFDRLDS